MKIKSRSHSLLRMNGQDSGPAFSQRRVMISSSARNPITDLQCSQEWVSLQQSVIIALTSRLFQQLSILQKLIIRSSVPTTQVRSSELLILRASLSSLLLNSSRSQSSWQSVLSHSISHRSLHLQTAIITS